MNRFLNVATGEARKSTYLYRLGAVVLRKNKIVGRGYNKLKTHPKLSKYGYYSCHAECDAIMRASEGDTLVVVRLLKSGKLCCSKPCDRCLKFAKDYGIKKIYYIDWDSSLKEMVL